MKTLAHPKNLGNTKSIDMESTNCHKNVTICVLVSRSYPDKNLLRIDKNNAIHEQEKNMKDMKDTNAPHGGSVKWAMGTKDGKWDIVYYRMKRHGKTHNF